MRGWAWSFEGEIFMIRIEEILVWDIDTFWPDHYAYLVDDGIVTDEEDKAYFRSEEYRGAIRSQMEQPMDTHHMLWFKKDGVRVGAAQYCTYWTDDGKCAIMDFWVFPPYRGKGVGHECFQALQMYTKGGGAAYYELNCAQEAAHRFWQSNGFVDNGRDEHGVPLMIKRQ